MGAPTLRVVADEPRTASPDAPVREAASDVAGARAAEGQAPRAEKQPLKPLSLPTSAIILRPRLYDDVKDVAEGVVSKHQPVILILRGSSAEVARRTLDFSFGLCCGIQAEMRQLGERVYAIVPRGTEIADADLTTLRHQGVIRG